MFAPHTTEGAEFIEIGCSSEFGFDQFKFISSEAKLFGGLDCYVHGGVELSGKIRELGIRDQGLGIGYWLLVIGYWLLGFR